MEARLCILQALSRRLLPWTKYCTRKYHIFRAPVKKRTYFTPRYRNWLGNPALSVWAPTLSKHQYSSRNANSKITPLFFRAEKFSNRIAVVDQYGSHTYDDLLFLSNNLTDQIADVCQAPSDDLQGRRVAFLCQNDVSFVVAQWACWMSGGIAVPLCKSHPSSELEYVIHNSQSEVVVATEQFAGKIAPISHKLGVKLLVLRQEDFLVNVADELTDDQRNEENGGEGGTRQEKRENRLSQLLNQNKFKHRPAMIVYSSGTTGRPKGVVHTHGSLQASMDDMLEAWEWNANDVILHVMPLHHYHGIVNVLMVPLYCGATCVMMPQFDPDQVWSKLAASPVAAGLPRRISLFMGVPTIYAKLIESHERRFTRGRGNKKAKEYIRAACATNIRLMVSGSAPLPRQIMTKWEEITGHKLLERYGMTECGMALTNSIRGPRTAGTVGRPFPQVEACIARQNVYSPTGYDVIAAGTAKRTKVTRGMEGEQGELYLKGPNLFKEYWNNPESTWESFTTDGWFKTGDTACYLDGVYKILGRTSVDIIKSGGYKISALDVENHLHSHPNIVEVIVLGLPDITWGQRMAAVVVLKAGAELTLVDLKDWAKDILPHYQIPSVLRVVEHIPKNSIGKVNKKEILNQLFASELKQIM